MSRKFKIPFDDDGRKVTVEEILARDGEIWPKTAELLLRVLMAQMKALGEWGYGSTAAENIRDDVERIVKIVYPREACMFDPPPQSLSPRRCSTYKKSAIHEDLRWAVFERDDFRCQKCGSRRNLSADHKHPEYRGGEASMENLQTLCRSCNSQKSYRVDA